MVSFTRITAVVFVFAFICLPAPAVEFPRGRAAHVVFKPRTPLEERVTGRLSTYLERVVGAPTQLVPSVRGVPVREPCIVLTVREKDSPLPIAIGSDAPEAFAIQTGLIGKRPAIVVVGKTELGLKRGIQRLIVESAQEPAALVIPDLHVSESPWMPQREWTACCWSPRFVRGEFVNPYADQRQDIWSYSDAQLEAYADMFDSFGFSGCQILETCYNYGVLGSPRAYRDRQKILAKTARANGQNVTLWVWAAQFTGFSWRDPEAIYTPQPGNTQFTDPAVHRTFEKYYDYYAEMAPDVDLLIAHFWAPGALTDRADIFKYLKFLEEKFKAKNPAVRMGIDFWGAQEDYMSALVENGFGDYLLLENSLPMFFLPGAREKLHQEAHQRGVKLGVWGWHMTEYETDQYPAMHVNARFLRNYYREMRDGVMKTHPIVYWSEMEACHLANIFSMYASGQLLWNPDRDPDELLHEVTNGIWGLVNGETVFKALRLIEDARTGETWATYWWMDSGFRLGTADPAADVARADASLRDLRAMKTDPVFVPKFPLPFAPDVFVELMIPHLTQIRLFAEFRIKMAALDEAASNGAAKDKLQAMLQEAWQPIPDFSTWVGSFGQVEARRQDQMVREASAKYGIEVQDPAWYREHEIERLVQFWRNYQRVIQEPLRFQPTWNPFLWPAEKMKRRFDACLARGVIEPAGDGLYRLAGWRSLAIP